jgi:hypothetical protein
MVLGMSKGKGEVMNTEQRSYQNALFVHENAGFVYVEMLALSAGVGFYLLSFPAFLIAYLVSLFLVKFRLTRILILQSLNVAWGFVGFLIGSNQSDQVGLLCTFIMYVIIYRLHSVDNCWV